MRSPAGKRTLGYALALCAALLAGCSHMPWHHAPPPPPLQVHEVELSGPLTFPQYWKRNTLLLDMTGVSGSGTVTLKPVEGTTWPVRIAVRVRPGAFPVLEVRGDQRQYLPISASGSTPVDIEFSPSVYTARTPQILIAWGAAAQALPAAAAAPSAAPEPPAGLTPH